MATAARAIDDKHAAPAEDAPAPEKPRRKLSAKMLIALFAGVFALGAGGASAWYFTGTAEAEVKGVKDSVKAPKAGKAAKTAGGSEKPAKPPVFLTMPQFTVNLQGEHGDQFLQTTIVFELTEESAVEAVKAQMPVIRSRLLLLLSSKRPSEISTLAGKETLVQEIIGEARKYVSFASAEQRLSRVHFNSFVIQ
ncbi:MAG: flagellar basal body-associated FliL family protein [Betaproteobacteria bacterium]|nr:flagellar basal body-associated FliL family protein [Betaproteobacteria bacterium]